MSKASVEFVRKLVECPELSESEIHVALTAAGVDELLPDGNRKLAQLGLGATAFLIDWSGAFMSLSRDFTFKLKSRVNGIQHRADIAKRTGVDRHLKFDCRPGARSAGVLALATSALVGAIYLRKKCFISVAKGLYALGVLDEHLDECSLMEIFKNEQNHLLMPSLVGNDPEQTSEIDVLSQEAAFPDFPTPDLGGLSNFDMFYNENGQLKECFSDELPLTGTCSQSPSTEESGRPVDGRQFEVQHSSAHREMHHRTLHEVDNPRQQAKQHVLTPRVELMVDDGLGQPVGPFRQITNQPSSSRHFPSKRKNIGGTEVQKMKSSCVDVEYRSTLCREIEMAQVLGLPRPEDTYFSPNVEYKLLSLGQKLFSSLCIFLVQVGGSHSLVALRAALKYTREMGDQLHSAQSRRWVSRDLTNNERFEIIGEIQDNETFLQILRCNHILHLYRYTGGTFARNANFAIEAASFDELNDQPKARGNPRKIEVATAVNKMMENIFPDLEPNSAIYRRKRRAVLQFRKFGQRLDILAECFGDAVLSLLHFDRAGDVAGPMIIEKLILAPTDEAFESFVKILEESQGHLLREISWAAKSAFEHLLYEDTRRQNLFALEEMVPEDILKLPKGSQELRNLLQ